VTGLDDPNDIGRCWWWLRSSGDEGRSAVDVGSDGRINDTGGNVVFEHFCVRPEMINDYWNTLSAVLVDVRKVMTVGISSRCRLPRQADGVPQSYRALVRDN